jgi:uncharacterized membrane protein (UPF0127 family)
MTLRMLLTLTLLLTCTGCAGTESPWVELKGQRFDVEIAADDASRTRGLMFRDVMPKDHGMLFVFESEEPLAFWMKNTRIPLDILYFDKALRLVSVAAGVPPCTTSSCPSYPSAGPASFTLELNAGLARQLGVKPGDALLLSPDIAADHTLDSR